MTKYIAFLLFLFLASACQTNNVDYRELASQDCRKSENMETSPCRTTEDTHGIEKFYGF